jgi:hypothetical protein
MDSFPSQRRKNRLLPEANDRGLHMDEGIHPLVQAKALKDAQSGYFNIL